MSLVAVKLKERYGIYNGGEVAGMEPATARHLVEVLNIAEYVNPPKAPTEENLKAEQVLPEEMTVVQLKELAKENNVHLERGLNKDGIIEALRAAGVLPEV